MKPTVLGLLIVLAGSPAFGGEPPLRLGDRRPQASAVESAASYSKLDTPVAAIAIAADPAGEARRVGFRVLGSRVQLEVVVEPANEGRGATRFRSPHVIRVTAQTVDNHSRTSINAVSTFQQRLR